ncbi:myelin and lymphocyte protein-like [Xiphophorus hellerii]|uniref:myelin and lymphocyte protein-like n=1 Tax=Xiphophorus hellerii TaxID=8084 RepID=UPI0013B442F4|nr:myelin and lymphocyte protein-like [Xiphophorus hellerii]
MMKHDICRRAWTCMHQKQLRSKIASVVKRDAGFHFVAAVFYLSASVVLAYITIVIGNVSTVGIDVLKTYRLDISAVVTSHVATLLYFLHAIFSAIRWKRA